MNAAELRLINPGEVDPRSINRNRIVFVLDSIYDTYNIGSFFRLADAVAAEAIYLCGDTTTPPNIKIHRAAVGTENVVPWHVRSTALEAAHELKDAGYTIGAVELNDRAIQWNETNLAPPIAFVLGNETTGVNKDVVDIADIVICLPMFGFNNSFNVWGVASVIAYKAMEGVLRHDCNCEI